MKFSEVLGKLLQNKGSLIALSVISLFLLSSLFAPLVAPFDPTYIYEGIRLPPFWSGDSQGHWLGTDDIGRDTLSRLIFGGRVSLMVGCLVVLLSMVVGIVLGLLSGYFGGALDRLIIRSMEILQALPSILLAIVVVAILGPGLNNAILAVSLVALPPFVRVVRAAVMAEKEKEYIQAAKSLGMSHTRIMFRQILPNCTPAIIVQATLGFSDGILNTAALGFLGLGAEPPLPEWGIMLSDSRPYIQSSPWMVVLPGLCILVVVLAFNVIGDALRDILDPKLRT